MQRAKPFGHLIAFAILLASSAAFAGDLPNPVLTPGTILTTDAKVVCVTGYTKTVRNVPTAEAAQVYAAYGVRSHKLREYEIDHLISLELGGSNAPTNLWPQSYITSPWNAHVKDKLENRLHAEVCAGRLGLAAAQTMIATDWIKTYISYYGAPAQWPKAQR